MKKALIALALAVASSTYGQGIITFFNNNLTGPSGVYRAGIFRAESTPENTIGAGAGYTAGLFLASNLNTPLATTTFRITTAQEVFATSQDVVIPGVSPGQTANLVVRAWQSASGSYANSVERGEQAFTSRPLGGPNPDPTQPAIPQPDMGPGFTGFVMTIPEPSTIALATLSVGALLLRRLK